MLSPHDDEHSRAVAGALDRAGVHAEVVDLADFPEKATLSMQFECCTGCGSSSIVVGGRTIDLGDIRSVWWRRAHHPAVSEAMVRPSHRVFAANETYEALGGLWASLDAYWINEPAADDRAHRKGFQLAVAQRLGLEIPHTLMTNDSDEAIRFVDSKGYRDVVYKSFSSTESEWRETRLLRTEEVQLLHHVRHAPVIFQEYVPARYDIRVTVIGDRVFPAAIHSQETQYPVDSRIDIINARLEPVDIPDPLAETLITLTRRLGLVYGAIDLRLTPDGRYVFLEINPSGQFLYIELATELPIAAAFADALVAGGKLAAPA